MATTMRYTVDALGFYEPAEDDSAKISPKKSLAWAEKDLKGSDQRARGNALSNLKKTLHARLDEIISGTHLRFAHDWGDHR